MTINFFSIRGILTNIFFAFAIICAHAQKPDFSRATIYVANQKDPLLMKSAQVLQEEVAKRTGFHWNFTKKIPRSAHGMFILGTEKDLSKLTDEWQKTLQNLPPTGPDGFKLAFLDDSQTVLVIGNDERGTLYGVGRLLRKMEMRQGEVQLPENLQISSTPRFPIRGHQLGYRPKTNAYDAWTVAQYDQYIRELALFGANSIEIMPPRTDDDFSNEHMKLPAIKMIGEQSRICASYGLDVWMWYPNMGSDYVHADSIKKELDERRKVFAAVPKLDNLFVPGGDPGDLDPEVLFDWLKKVAEVLHEYHPNAKIWVSPQVFRPTQAWFDAFYAKVNKDYPWLGGVVFGPWIKTPIQQIRKLIKPSIPIRRYPDITHSLSSQYPIPRWDLAYAMTLGRECINPRPTEEKAIQNAFAEYAEGSISYSEGANDDVNKFVWSGQDWDPTTPVAETLRDYARLFIGPDYAGPVAQGLLALEQDIHGPLLTNDQVPGTLKQWRALEKKASPKVLGNFRFQQGLIRAYFDAYTQRRLIYETELEQEARDALANASKTGSTEAMEQAREILLRAHTKPVRQEYRQRCLALADSLYHSIGAQLMVEKYGAEPGRGNFIDNIDVPLNDAVWILDRLTQIGKIPGEPERVAAIHAMLHRTDPGPGGYYTNFGAPGSWQHVISNKAWEADPGSLQSPRVSFGVGLKGREWVHEVTAKGFEGQATPLAWTNQVTTLYDQPLQVYYYNLDPKANYTLRVAYTGRFRSKMKLMADDILVHDFIQTGEQPVYEFTVPQKALTDGKVTFSWAVRGRGARRTSGRALADQEIKHGKRKFIGLNNSYSRFLWLYAPTQIS